MVPLKNDMSVQESTAPKPVAPCWAVPTDPMYRVSTTPISDMEAMVITTG